MNSRLPTFPALLQVEEKHETYHFLLSSMQDLYDISLRILKERHRCGYYYHDPGTVVPIVEMTEEQIQSIPKGPSQDALADVRKQQLRTLRQWERDSKEYRRIVRAIETEDGKEAWSILDDHSEAQYERVVVLRFDNPKRYRQ